MKPNRCPLTFLSLGPHVLGPVERAPFYQDEIDARFCACGYGEAVWAGGALALERHPTADLVPGTGR